MDLISTAKRELIKKGMKPAFAEQYAKDLFIGFPLQVAEKYAQQKWKEGAKAQRVLCSNTNLLDKYGSKLGLELTKSIQLEVKNAPEPNYK